MCGRYTLTDAKKALLELIDPGLVPPLEPPRYNIAPSQNALAVVRHEGGVEALTLRWGFIPSWAKDAQIGNQLINARAETVHEKPSFRRAFKTQRCLVPADGFYEWKREGKRRTPMYIRLKEGRPFAFAGLWNRWRSSEDKEIRTFAIITTGPNTLIKLIHHRMPVILKQEWIKSWLDPSLQDEGVLREMLTPRAAGEMEAYPVSTLVNSPENDRPECVKIVSQKGGQYV